MNRRNALLAAAAMIASPIRWRKTTRNFVDVIRADMERDPQFKSDVNDALVELLHEQGVYDHQKNVNTAIQQHRAGDYLSTEDYLAEIRNRLPT